MWTYSIERPGRLRRLDAPTPQNVGPGEVLLRPLSGGICGSDMAYYRGQVSHHHDIDIARRSEVPGFSLHETVGEVLECPGGEHTPGDVVVGWVTDSDGLAERVVTAASSVVKVPEGMEPTIAVALQPLACVLDITRRIPRVAGARTAVIGLGPIGLLFGHVLRSAGVSEVVGVDPVDRTAVAETFGMNRTIMTSAQLWSMNLEPEDRPDLVIEAVGHQVGTLTHCLHALRPGGTLFYFGVPDDDIYPLPMDRMFRQSLTLMSGNVRDHSGALREAIRYATEHPGLLKALVSHTFSVHQAQEAFALADTVHPDRLKVVLDFMA
ncbi:zinc-dependent alcohol dehydrogenase [Streptomyces sp. NPDC004752]